MTSSKEYRDYVLEQLELAGVSDVSCRPMMGEYLLYFRGVLSGGIYDDRLLVKKANLNDEDMLPETFELILQAYKASK